MKFHSYQYVRPDLENVKVELDNLLQKLQKYDKESFAIAFSEYNQKRDELTSFASICEIRHTINTEDDFYNNEQEFWDEASPELQSYDSRFYEILWNCPFRDELEEKYGTQLFKLAECTIKSFHPSIIGDLQQENKLTTQYEKLKAAGKIPFEGKTYTLTQMQPFLESTNRETRKQSSRAVSNFYAENSEEFDKIYDDLVKVRSTIAKKLGFENFVELAYYRMMRTDYTASDVAVFREGVKKHIVPVVGKLLERQQKRIGVDNLYFYDEGYEFPTGNPTPKGDAEWIVKQGEKMYQELSPETNKFFQFMVEHDLMDLVAKEGKAGGGYCTYIPTEKSPYIFSNFNGTSGDIDVLTHEAGHAFQVFESRNMNIPEYYWPTFESCEIHSMSMEFFTWPWMKNFFKEDTSKYYFSHLSGAVSFIPYGVLVDDFQHKVYENPELTPSERKALWRSLEKEYLPHRDYENDEFLEEGGYWQRQSHIYQSPFYYIDYTLAQICALQYWSWMREDNEAAWNSYVQLCQKGGSESFVSLVEGTGLKSPFKEGCVEETITSIAKWLEEFKESELA